MPIDFEKTVPTFSPALDGSTCISPLQDQISRIEGFNTMLYHNKTGIVYDPVLPKGMTYERWCKAAPGKMTLQRWYESRVSKILPANYTVMVINSSDMFVPWNTYLADLRSDYKRKPGNHSPTGGLAYERGFKVVSAAIRCVSVDIAAKLNSNLFDLGYKLQLREEIEKKSTGLFPWDFRHVYHGVLSYSIRFRGYERQIREVGAMMHTEFTRHSAKFSVEPVCVSVG